MSIGSLLDPGSPLIIYPSGESRSSNLFDGVKWRFQGTKAALPDRVLQDALLVGRRSRSEEDGDAFAAGFLEKGVLGFRAQICHPPRIVRPIQEIGRSRRSAEISHRRVRDVEGDPAVGERRRRA